MIDRIINTSMSVLGLERGDRAKNYGYFEGALSIVINIVLFVFKFVFGIMLRSVSLLAESFHTLSDVVTSSIVILGFKISSKPADEKHPFGHGRAERVFSIVIALILIVVGVEFFISSFRRFLNPVPISGDLVVILVLILSIGAKELLANISFNLSKRIKSASLRADAWHHRTDSIATALVVLGFVLFRFGLYRVDGVIGMGVSLLIAYTGISIIREAGSFLVGEAPDSALVERIKNTASGFDGIDDVHHIHVHDYAGQLEVTVHVRLGGDTHLAEAHKTASEVEKAIKKCVPGAEVTVHVEPIDRDEQTK